MLATIIRSALLGLTLGAVLACAAEPRSTCPLQAQFSHLSIDFDIAAAPACGGALATVSACVSDPPRRF